jgi:prepilin-type N-terminal cleavage/methylation domain-containing protein
MAERQRGERQRIAISEWRLDKRQQEASRKWRIVSRQSPVANRQSPVAAFRLAFTLTELLTVIAIIAILMGLLFTFYRPSQEQRKVFECQNHLQVIHRALRLYMLDWEGFPASPYDTLNNDKDSIPGSGVGLFDEDSTDGVDAQVGGLLALSSYLRSQRMLLCPSDPNAAGGSVPSDYNSSDNQCKYSSYQGCDTGVGFEPPRLPCTQVQTCPQGVPTYAITRFPPDTDCHPSGRDDDKDGWVDEDPINFRDDDGDGKVDEDPPNVLTPSLCRDPDRLRQLGIMNVAPYYPVPTFPADDTVVTWCVHHRYMPNTTTPNYTKGGVPADLVLYLDGTVRIQQMRTPDGTVRIQQMRTPDQNWRRKPNEP